MTASSPVDVLGEALHFLRMTGVFYASCELTRPWGLALPAREGCLSFHVVTAGRCSLEVDGDEPCVLEPGELALVPHGTGHRLWDGAAPAAARSIDDLPYEQVSDRYAILRHGGRGGAPSTLICGAARFDHPAAHHLIALLPRVIRVTMTDAPQRAWIESTLGLMATEAREPQPGGESIVTRLADILVIQGIRSWIQRDPAAHTGWIGGLQDAQIGRAVMMIHREPARPWTVASLAAEVAMSRSAFAARFTELVGEPAMTYLARWRMHVATTWLRTEDLGLGELATRLGYRSEASFSRAFKRYIGIPPGAVRRGGADATAAAAMRAAH
jgi:AraC-like DNA-binding protein